jgi:glycine/D-amino acid oxidase-like deaminating enzyme/nitrite reductase/ring-hydroxylating ferredoxin subunit
MKPTDPPKSLWLDRAATIPTDPYSPGAHYDAIVIGAGLTGLSTAVMLARGGVSVAVIEARTVGAVATGNTTAKLSLLQGSVLSGIDRHFSGKVVRAYVDSNLAGQEWLLRFLGERGVPTQQRDAYSYANCEDGVSTIDKEFAVAAEAGLPVERLSAGDIDLPFETSGGIRLRSQTQFDPMEVLAALAVELRSLSGVIIEGQRVTDVSAADPAEVTTPGGTVTGDHVVLATGSPILDRGLYFAKLVPQRSYAAAYRVLGAPASFPTGMYLSVDSPSRSLRTAPDGTGGELLLVGGNGHIVGREDSTSALVAELDAWTKQHFAGAELTHRWSAQDYQSANAVPFVGWLPRGRGRIFVATGYNKWGMTNGVAAALNLSADILGTETPDWASTLGHRVTSPSDLATGAKAGIEVAAEYAKGWVQAEVTGPNLAKSDVIPAEGEGIVGREGRTPTAVSTVDGRTCAVSGVCTHLGGILNWNDAERSWDCPLHGSRFGANGAVLEGPAVKDLPTVETNTTDVGGAH